MLASGPPTVASGTLSAKFYPLAHCLAGLPGKMSAFNSHMQAKRLLPLTRSEPLKICYHVIVTH